MKRFLSATLIALIVLLPSMVQAKVTHLLPKPHSVVENGGTPFALGRPVTITYTGGAEECTLLENFFIGNGCTIGEGGATVNVTIVESIDGTYDYTLDGFDNEAYTLTVTADAIEITAVKPVGVIRAAQTLAQLAEGYSEGEAAIETVEITDWAAFKLRGFMHDVGRSFIEVETLKKHIDLLSRFKVNCFHWHFTENQAWRFEVEGYPALTSTASMTRFAGKYYTQEQCKDVAAYAKERGVIIIPEIDMPGHSEAFVRAMGYDMQTDEGVEVLKNVLTQVASVFPDAPYIHIGADEKAITYTDANGKGFLAIMVDHIHGLGKKVVVWNPISGVNINNTDTDMTQMWSSAGNKIAGRPNIDCRYNYTNHFDVFADVVGIYRSNIYYVEQGNTEVAGTISAYWNDRKTPTEEDIVKQNNMYANVIASAERAWRGGGKQYIEAGGTMLPNSGEEYDEFADWERRFLFHKANSLAGEPIPYVKQTNIRWRITDAFPNGGDASMVFPPETEEELQESYTYNGNTYYTGIATGAGIYLRHTWGNNIIPTYYGSTNHSNATAYAWTYVYSDKEQAVGAQIEFQNYGRSEKDKAPDNGNWDRKGSNIWINGERVAPPTWTNAGKSINNEVDLGNENFTARKPIAVTLKQGWNKVFIKLPYVSANGVRLNKWMFTCVFTDTEGKNAVEGLIYSPNQCKDKATELVAAKISEIKRDRGAYIGTAVGLWPESAATTIDAKIAEIEATYSETMTEEQRATQVTELTTAWTTFVASLTADNMNKPVNGNYYRMSTPLRGNRYPTSKGAGNAVVGETATSKANVWKFITRTDRTFDIVNLADGTYISPASSNNTALNAVAAQPSAGWTIKPANEKGYVIITSGSAQFNQTNSGQNYKVYNWGSGTNTSDTGCKYIVTDVTESNLPEPFVKMGLASQTYPYALDDALADKIFAKENLTIAIDVTMPSSISGRKVLVGAADPSEAPRGTAIGTNPSPYVGLGLNGNKLAYITSSRGGDVYTAKTTPLSVSTNYKIVYVLDKSNNTFKSYINGTPENTNSLGESFQDFAHLATNENAKIYIGGGMVNTTTGWDVFAGQIHSVQFFDEVLTENIIGLLEYPTTVSYPFTTEVEGYDSNNPNTHLGTVTFTSNGESESVKLAAGATATNWFSGERNGSVSCSLTREYRGFEFIGFFIGDENLGKIAEIAADKLNTLTITSPLVAKFKATNDVTLFYDDDEKSYRIPAIATTSTGRIIAVSDYRHNLDDIGRDNHGTGTKRIDLVARTSDDNGKTWSDVMTIAAGDNSKTGSYLRAFGDAAIVAVGEKIVVMSAAGDVLYPSATAANPNRMARIFSSDNGATWSIEEMTTKMYSTETSLIPSGVAAFFGSGKLVVDANFNNTNTARIYGALLVRTYINSAYNNYNNYVVYSDDLGETWAILGGSQTPVASGDEPKVEILPSGQILLSARRSGGRIFNVFTYGTGENDKANGAGTWGTAVNGCNNGGSNATNGEIFCIDAKNPEGEAVKLLLQSQPKGGSGQYDRRDVSIWYKEISATATYTPNDIASNWIQGIQVSTQQSSYSAVTLQNDGKVALFFEEAPCYGDDYTKGYSMVYVPLTTEQITGGKYFSSATDPTVATTINVTLTDANGNTYCDVLNCALGSVKDALVDKYPYITLGAEDSFIPTADGEAYDYTNSVTLAFKVSNNTTTAWNNIYFPSNGNNTGYPIYLSASSANDTHVSKVTEAVAYGSSQYNTLDNAEKISWAIYNVNNSFSFTFKNKLTGKFIKVENVATGNAKNVSYADEADATAFTIVPDAANYNGDYALASVTGEATSYVCSTSASYGYATNYSGNAHQGAWVKIVEAPDYAALIASANAAIASFGDGLGEYKVAEGNQALLAEAKSAMNDAGNVKLEKLNAYIELTEGATLNMPQAGGFYRISYDYGTAGVKYLQGVASSVKGVAYTADKGAASIFYYADGQLLSYTAGTYLKETGNTRGLQGVGVAGGTVTFAESPRTKGKYTITIPAYLHANSSGSNYFSDHCSGDGGHAAHDHSIEAVEELPVTIGATGYSTLFAPVALEIPENVAAYRAVINGNYIYLYEFEGTIPAGQAVILQGAANTYNFTITEDVEFTGENDLLGTTKKIATSDVTNPYTLQRTVDGEEGDVIMRRYVGEYINAFKMYMSISDAQASALSFRFPGTTAVESIEAEGAGDGRVYDLFGRPVENPAKGIYIIDGNKVIY